MGLASHNCDIHFKQRMHKLLRVENNGKPKSAVPLLATRVSLNRHPCPTLDIIVFTSYRISMVSTADFLPHIAPVHTLLRLQVMY